jgi:hypothetical protein
MVLTFAELARYDDLLNPQLPNPYIDAINDDNNNDNGTIIQRFTCRLIYRYDVIYDYDL